MLEFILEARKKAALFLESLGIDVLYLVTALMVILVLVNWKQFRNWDNLSRDQREWLKALLFGVGLMILINAIRFLAW